MKKASAFGLRSRRLGHVYTQAGALARYHSIAPRAFKAVNTLRRHTDAQLHPKIGSGRGISAQRNIDLNFRYFPQINLSQDFVEWDRNLSNLRRYAGYEIERPFKHPVDQIGFEIEKLATETIRTYAKLALARASQVVSTLPRIERSPGEGIVLQTSTDKGTINLIMEEGQAILVRAGDDFAVQATCNLNPGSISELLDIYEIELHHVA